MKPGELQPILARAVGGVKLDSYWDVPPEAKVVTGNPRWDEQLHYALVEYGVEVGLDKHHNMEDYRIVDDKKFMMFLLRWA